MVRRLVDPLAALALVFPLPATIAILGAAVVWAFVRDTPSSVGLPELKTGKAAPADAKPHTKAEEKAEHKAFLRRKVFLNPTIWIIAVGNFFVYIVRFAVLDWGPTMLKEHLHMDTSTPVGRSRHSKSPAPRYARRGWATDRFLRRAARPRLRDLHADDRALPRGALYPQ